MNQVISSTSKVIHESHVTPIAEDSTCHVGIPEDTDSPRRGKLLQGHVSEGPHFSRVGRLSEVNHHP